MTVSFNQIPAAGLVDPIFAIEINPAGFYASASRLLLIGHKTTSGTLTANVPVLVASQSDADAVAGPGSMLREMFRIARQNAPVQEIWLMHVAETGVAQTWTATIAAAATGTAGVAYLSIGDETVSVSIAATDTVANVATNLAAAISGYSNALTGAMLPVTATAAAAVVTITARHFGTLLNDLLPYKADIAGNIFSISGALTIASGTAGTGIPTLTTALAALGDDQYDFVVAPWGDATSTAAYTALMNDTSGRWSYARQSYGHIWSVSTGSLSTLQTLGQALNDRHLTIIGRGTASVSASYLWPAAIAARRAAWLSDYVTGNVSRNATGLVVQGLQGPRDRSTWLGYSARNSLVQSGISPTLNNFDGSVSIDKEVTTYQKGTSGQADATFRDVQSIYQAMWVVRVMKADLQNSCSQKALALANPGNNPNIVTPADIASLLIASYGKLAERGIVQNAAGFTKYLNVEINPGNPARADVFLPIERVKPLDIFAINSTIFTGSIPA